MAVPCPCGGSSRAPLPHRPAGHRDQGDRLARPVLHDQVAQRLQVLPPGARRGARPRRTRRCRCGSGSPPCLARRCARRRPPSPWTSPYMAALSRSTCTASSGRASSRSLSEAAELRRHGGASQDLQHAVGEVLEHPGILADDLDVHGRPPGEARPPACPPRSRRRRSLRPTLSCMRARVSKLSKRRSWYSGEVHHDGGRRWLPGCRLSAGCLRRRRWSPPTRRPRSPGRRALCSSSSRAMLSRYSTRVPTGAWASTPDLPGRDVLREEHDAGC